MTTPLLYMVEIRDLRPGDMLVHPDGYAVLEVRNEEPSYGEDLYGWHGRCLSLKVRSLRDHTFSELTLTEDADETTQIGVWR